MIRFSSNRVERITGHTSTQTIEHSGGRTAAAALFFCFVLLLLFYFMGSRILHPLCTVTWKNTSRQINFFKSVVATPYSSFRMPTEHASLHSSFPIVDSSPTLFAFLFVQQRGYSAPYAQPVDHFRSLGSLLSGPKAHLHQSRFYLVCPSFFFYFVSFFFKRRIVYIYSNHARQIQHCRPRTIACTKGKNTPQGKIMLRAVCRWTSHHPHLLFSSGRVGPA